MSAHHPEIHPGWKTLISDRGRYWATRIQPFSPAQVAAGASRTVDGDDLDEIRSAIAEQESRAERLP